jgi:Ca2+-binding EF-hand superfamily protein
MRPIQCSAQPAKSVRRSPAALAAESKAKEKRRFLLQLTPEERAEQKEPLLDHAESAIADYCVTLPEDSEACEQCWLAYDYFEHRKARAEEGCDVSWSQSRLGPECKELESFEGFVRQLLGYTPIKSVVRMLYGMRNAELAPKENKPKAEIAEVESKGGKPQYELVGAPEEGKERLVALFGAMDKDGNGKLDAQEFRDAMDKLSNDHLPGGTVGTIFSAMNLHGAITLEDFLQIVEAEEMNSDTQVSRWLRAHKGESPLWGSPIDSM